MEDIFAAFFTVLGIKNEALKEASRKGFHLRHVAKGTLLYRQGEPIEEIAFMGSDGVIRAYYVTEDGRDITQCFETEIGRPLTPGFDMEKTILCQDSVETLTDLDIIVIQNEYLQQLYRTFPEVAEIINGQLDRAWHGNRRIRDMLSTCKGIERVKWLDQTYPQVTGVAKEADIASFLGITSVQLSRIRKRLKEVT